MLRPTAIACLVLVAGCEAASSAPTKSPKPAVAKPVPATPTHPPHCVGDPVPDCTAYGFDLGTTRCTKEGDVDITSCVSVRTRSDVFYGTPVGGFPSNVSPTCGNLVVDVVTGRECAPCRPPGPCACADVQRKIEQCDGQALDGMSCEKLGYLGGTLACRQCRFDAAACTPSVGLAAVNVAQLGGLSWGSDFPAALGAMPGSVAVAWINQAQSRGYQNPTYDAVFAWTDPSLTVLRTSKPFPVGFAGELQLSGNSAGWLLAISTYGDNPGPAGPAIRVVPISTHGHVGKPGAKVEQHGLQFLARGAVGEPSLVGASTGGEWQTIGWLVDDAGEPIGKPFPIGSSTPAYSRFAARAAYLGGGRFVVARGSSRDPAIEVSLVDTKGAVQLLPLAHAELKGTPVTLSVAGDRVTLLYTRSDKPGSYLVMFAADGNLIEAPKLVSQELAVGLIGSAKRPALVTVDKGKARLQPLAGGGAQTVLGEPGLYVPQVVDSDDGSFAFAISSDSGKVVRLR